MRALARAEAALAADLPRYLDLWALAVPEDFQDRAWDYARFGRGERFVHQAIPQAEFAEIMVQVERWGLGQHLKDTTSRGSFTHRRRESWRLGYPSPWLFGTGTSMLLPEPR